MPSGLNYERIFPETGHRHLGTKRSPSISGGKRGVPTTNLSGLKCLPLDPVSAGIRTRLELNTPYESLQTMIEGGPDIVEGDVLKVPVVADDFSAVIVEADPNPDPMN